MAKVIQFPIQGPEKFGFKPARKESSSNGEKKQAQLNLFNQGKVVNLHPLSVFEEALQLDDQGNKKAKDFYLKAIREGDSVADAYCNLGIMESHDGNPSKAIDCFTKCLRENPRHFEAHYNLANVYAEIGNFALAKAHYQISIELEPQFPNSHFNLALTLAMNKEVAEAIDALKTYCRLVPPSDQAQAIELIENLSLTLG